MAPQHANRLLFRWLPRSKSRFLHLHAYIFLPGVPVTSSSRLPGVELAVLLLLLAPKPGQRQSNYRLAHEELRRRSFKVLKSRCLMPLALKQLGEVFLNEHRRATAAVSPPSHTQLVRTVRFIHEAQSRGDLTGA